MKAIIRILFWTALFVGCQNMACERRGKFEGKGVSDSFSMDTLTNASSDISIDSLLPDFVYDKIINFPDVRFQIERLEAKGSKIEIYLKNKPSSYDDFFIIQVAVDEVYRMRPIFNFKYFPGSDSLFYEDTLKDTLIYIK